MTVQSVYRLLCDGPHCPANVLSDDRIVPEGWRELVSTDHLDLSTYPDSRRPRQNRITRSEVVGGRFKLLLCPEHLTAFDAHRPQTSGGRDTRSGDQIVNVSCSCGARFPWTTAASIIAPATKPSYNPERAWWRHLPDELRWYATREAVGA